MNMLTRSGSFSTEEETRQRSRVISSRPKRYKKRNGLYDFLRGYGSQDTSMARPRITSKELDFYLYGRNVVAPVQLEGESPEEYTVKQHTAAKKIPNYAEKSVEILQLRYKPGVEREFRSSQEFNKVLATIRNIPSQVHLCYSSIPGAGFGICAADTIPSGTWIGPYEGKRVSIEEMKHMLDTRYVWEIYKNGVLDHCINGIDLGESAWCWMKYIQCARNTNEQNTVAFQFGADIYFQIYKTVKPGEEILVWYAEYYEQHHGIPVGVRKLAKNKESSPTATQTSKVSERNQHNQDVSLSICSQNPRPTSRQGPYTTPENHPPALTSDQVGQRSPGLQPPHPTDGNTSKCISPDTQPPPLLSENPPTSSQRREQKRSKIYHRAAEVARTANAQAKASPEGDISVAALHHLKTRFWKCDHCLSKFPQKWALQVHSCPCVVPKPYKCSNCNKAYVNKEDVEAHSLRCGGGRQFKCGYCGRSFINVNILSKHLRVHSRQTVAGGYKRKARVPAYQRLVQ